MRLSSTVAIISISFFGLASAEDEFPPIEMDRLKNSAFTFLMNDAIQGYAKDLHHGLDVLKRWTKYLNKGTTMDLVDIVEEGFKDYHLLGQDEHPPTERFFCPKAALLLKDD